ncbi:hypothetical protein [Archangium lansingense]|uniref:Uncharacterized protein n=1 Tax=Archangium lansingense TaxID=2995310 RepID=A0ABT4AQJ7_9BACT|nr:hypothetical protein [Archangium lansinium]MCY1083062.1 hypothetical protein [Archangium lansinium]
MGMTPRPGIHLDIDSLVLADGLVFHPEAFREALGAHLSRLLTEHGLEGLAPGTALRLESASLELPPGLDTQAAAEHAAAQLLAHLTGGLP